MRRLGARLGVEAMSLYRHVGGKADLLDSLQAAVLAEVRPPSNLGAVEDAHWRPLLGGLARALRKALLRHPNVVPLFATRPIAAPEMMELVERVWTSLERDAFTLQDAKRSMIAIGVYTIGHTLGETHGRPAAHLGAPAGPGAAEFEFGIEALLEGIARRDRSPPPRRTRASR
jgi:AcrR family transcriptional regulator